ncbi:MAG: DUF192 domain-containing protein [Candidatus Micrarchaeota archaeon]|nr:DUF192 domain-containing protein [Candidatus Micrarchaeota archaeon]
MAWLSGKLGGLLHRDKVKGWGNYGKAKVSYRDNTFTAYVADSRGKVMKGLMGREALGKDEAMLFIFEREGRQGFWMLNMKFSIDIVWLDKSKRITYIAENAKPCGSIFNCPVYRPKESSLYVLELKAGIAHELGMKTGDALRW